MCLKKLLSIGLACIYLSSIIFANLYFSKNEDRNVSENNKVDIKFKNIFSDWSFDENPLSEEVLNKLGNGDIKNGVFRNSQSSLQVRYFLGKWDPSNPKQMAVVSHTPDICWVGAGWKAIDLDQPSVTYIPWLDAGSGKTLEIEFQTRVFEHVLSKERELAMWCTLVDGRPIVEPKIIDENNMVLSKNLFKRALGSLRNSQLALNRFHTALTERKSWSGPKTFLRISMPLSDGTWSNEYENLIEFSKASFL
jgi:hypothetical protein